MPRIIREAVAAFEGADALEAAVFALETHGFDRAAFSLLAEEATVARKLGHHYHNVMEMEDEPAAPRETFFSRISRAEAEYGLPFGLASIGALALAGGGAIPTLVAAGGGAVLGAALGRMMHHHHAVRVKEQMARGGLLLWVDVRDAAQEKMAVEILMAHSAHDVHVHELRV